MSDKKVFISIGDLSARNYIYEIFSEGFENFSFSAITDDKLEGIGFKSVGRIEDISVTGGTEVIPRLPAILKTFRRARDELKSCDCLIACDAPGFNLKLIKEARKSGVKKVIYFISPQVWAWKRDRVRTIANFADHMVVILPFEVEIYKRIPGIKVHYLGHPLVDLVGNRDRKGSSEEGAGVNCLLMPGSRWSEIKKHTRFLKKVISKADKDLIFTVPTLKRFKGFLEEAFRGERVKVLSEEENLSTYDIMGRTRGGLIASGTASLEAALMGIPHAIFYRVNPLTYHLAKLFVKIDSINLPNIILGRKIVPELINSSPEDARKALMRVLFDEKLRERQKLEFSGLREILGGGGVIDRLRTLFLELLS